MANRAACTVTLIVVIAGLCLVTDTASAGKRIFKLSDPSRDDHGDGSLVYPETADLERGDLDLVAFSAKKVRGGTELQATFSRKIKQPLRQSVDAGGTQLTELARHGFFTFNIDVYIDMDRTPGSGRITTLPGRNAEVHPDHAWEKAICLTPRPEIARTQLRRILLWQAKKELKSEQGNLRREHVTDMSQQIEIDVADNVYFPNRIRVTGPKISFFVPDSFLGAPMESDWSYVIAVSGSDVTATLPVEEVDVGIVEVGFAGLMIIPVHAGGSRYTFGSSEPDTELMPVLVDLIVPPGIKQEELLASYRELTGQKVQLPGVVPGH